MADNNGSENDMSAYLFVDTFSFEKLALQPECRVGQRGAQMTGYETYIIEQWACQRRVNRVVASYTGNSQHVVEVQVLLVPSNLEKWSQVTLSHFEELVRMHILPKETPLGNMLVTSLSSLPSNLSLISMPEGFRHDYAYFVVNENLRRLNVVGRIAVTAEAPSDSMIATFRRVFMTSPSVSASYAVQEVATLIQIALFYYGLIGPGMVDGLLCDHTLKAIETWWGSFGRQKFRIALPRQQDKLYMRMSCSAMVGTVIGARQRLSALGLKPPKDPFDAENFVDCIKRFQKLMKIPRTSKLDGHTYFKLLNETAKNSSLGYNNMLTAMKSTVKEGLSGKATEAVDDWETLNLEQLINNVRGERAKYLWQGKGSEKVPHLISSLPVFEIGQKTGIPLFSLAAEESERQLHHHHHLHRSRHHQHDAAPAIESNENTNSKSKHSSHLSSGSHQLGEAAHVSNNDPNIQDADQHPSVSPEHAHDVHNSIVGRFRKRKPGLGDAFDDKNMPPPNTSGPNSTSTMPSAYAHMRTKSASSDVRLAKQSQQMNVFTQGYGEGLASVNDLNEYPTDENKSSSEDELTAMNQQHHQQQNKNPEQRCPCRIPPCVWLTLDDQAVDVGKPQSESSYLRRTASLSEIDQRVFPWESFASEPRILQMYSQAKGLQEQVSQRMNSDDVVNRQIESDRKANESAIAESQRDNVLIKYHVSATLKKEEAIHRRVQELEAFMARLDYEVATLSVKLKDVDQSVLAFATKVDTADRKWSSMKNVQIKPWWSRFLSWCF